MELLGFGITGMPMHTTCHGAATVAANNDAECGRVCCLGCRLLVVLCERRCSPVTVAAG